MARGLSAALVAASLLVIGPIPAAGRARPHPYDSGPAWSPSGRYIAYLRDETVHVMRPDGTGDRSLPGVGLFSWSRDDRVAFSHRDDRGVHLYSSRPDGSALRQITFGASWDLRPAWSPDGRSLLFVRSGEYGSTDIWRVSVSGGRPVRLTKDGHSFLSYLDRVWSPDGRRFAFVSCAGRKCTRHRNDIFVMSSSGGPRHRLTWSNDNNTPTWSPDGSLVAYFTAKDYELDKTSRAEIKVVRPDGRGRRSITRSGSHDFELSGNGTSMSWSPNGRRIVFDVDSNPLEGRSELWIVGRDGRGAHPWLRGAQGARAFDQDPAWSADGRWIAFGRLYPDRRFGGQLFGSIHAGHVDGTHLRRLTY